jgi:hypothetical protein
MGFLNFELYKFDGNILKKIIELSGYYVKKILFPNNYVIIFHNLGLTIFDTNQMSQDHYNNAGEMIYKRIGDFGIPQVNGHNPIYDSFVEIDEKTLDLKCYLREETNKPLVIENFRFVGGKFELESTDTTDYTITADSVEIRSEAGTNSSVLLSLNRGAIVEVLKRSEKAFNIGDKKGFWVYIDTEVPDGKGGTVLGWVVDNYLKEEAN